MLAFGAWFGHSAYDSAAGFTPGWAVLWTSVAAVSGLAFGYFISGMLHYLHGKFVLGVD